MSDPKTCGLLGEDNPADARLMCELLSEVPHQTFAVTVVPTLREARESVTGHDVVLLDLSLPDAHGLGTVSQMAEAASGVPVIVLTGTTDAAVVMQAVTRGADDYLVKSEVTPSLVARALLYAIERRRGAEASRQMLALEIARGESERSAKQARFLADLSAALATQLKVDDFGLTVTGHVGPEYAYFCAVHVADEHGNLAHVFAMVAEPVPSGRDATLASLKAGRAPVAVVQAISERREIEVPDAAAVVHVIACWVGQRGALESLEVERAWVLPMIARDRVVGALTLASGRASGDRDFLRPSSDGLPAAAEELARRTAVALDNALLHAAMQRAVRGRDEMLAVVSHDLRNPLSVFDLTLRTISHYIETGRMPRAETVSKASRAIKRMERLLEDLLDVARIDAGSLLVTKTDVDIGAIVSEVVEQNLSLAAEKGINLQGSVSGPAHAQADRHRIIQVITNLLANALKFTPRDGSVFVDYAPSPATVRVTVRDTGPGIARESLPFIFDRFFQSHVGRGGIGLGLAIARGIVEAHGGRIGVESTVGEGSHFWFELPTSDTQDVTYSRGAGEGSTSSLAAPVRDVRSPA